MGLMSNLFRWYRQTEEYLLKPTFVYFTISVQMAVAVILTVLSGLDGSLKLTDAVPFYVINVLVYLFGLYSVSKRQQPKLLLSFLIVHMILAVALSFGIGKFFSSRSIERRICRANGVSCDDILEPITQSIVRNSILCFFQVIFLHPTTSFVLRALQDVPTVTPLNKRPLKE